MKPAAASDLLSRLRSTLAHLMECIEHTSDPEVLAHLRAIHDNITATIRTLVDYRNLALETAR